MDWLEQSFYTSFTGFSNNDIFIYTYKNSILDAIDSNQNWFVEINAHHIYFWLIFQIVNLLTV